VYTDSRPKGATVKLRWILAVFFLASQSWAAKVTVDDLMRLRSLFDVRISPDGKRVAYVVSTPSIERAEHEAVLWLVPSVGGTPQRLTYSTKIFNKPLPSPCLRWSPDGSSLSFVGDVNGIPQVLAMSASGGEPWPLTSVPDGVSTYEWSPNGKQIAFLGPDPLAADLAERMKNKSYVIAVDRNDRLPRLWVQDVPGGKPRPLSPANESVTDFQWTPDGLSIAYSASNRKGFYARYQSRVFVATVSSGERRSLVDRAGVNRAPRFSPDGRWVAFISSGGHTGMIAPMDLHVVSADGKSSIRNLSGPKEAWIGEFVWAPDSRSLLYVPNEQTNATGDQMFEQAITRIWLDSGKIEPLTSGPVVNYSVSFSADGSRIAYKSVESRNMGDVYVMTVEDRHATRITEVNPELRTLELGGMKAVSWKSFDGKEIWGLLLTPAGYKPGVRIPLVVYCHGGPIGGFTYGVFPQFMHTAAQIDPYPVEAMASAGMAVLFPMPRGGSGYGISGFREIVNSWGEADYKDIMAGLDYTIAQGIADPERLGVMGASYGGYMTDWIVTQTGRFKAASTGASISDLAQQYYTSDAGEIMVEYFGLPWEAGASLAAHSAITHVTKVTTPLLIQHGENDRRVPISQAWEFYRALKALDKRVEFDIYPRGGHVNYEPPLEREYMRRNLDWFIRWLKPDAHQFE
jgi:dipeptidyl aminopeptidase/acylaminoacyl peptidase